MQKIKLNDDLRLIIIERIVEGTLTLAGYETDLKLIATGTIDAPSPITAQQVMRLIRAKHITLIGEISL